MSAASRRWTVPRLGLLLLGLFSAVSRALEPEELFPFGEEAGDQRLPPGSDSTAELRLHGALMFFSKTSDKIYINTNGFAAPVRPPAEDGYLGKMPADFPVLAALLGNLEAGRGGRGGVHYRADRSPAVLRRAGGHVRAAFPTENHVEPDSVAIVTWDKMAAEGTAGRGDDLDAKRNTFQLVLASMKDSSSWAILLYPKDGLQFFSSPVGGASKPLEVGFNEGLVSGWFWGTKQGAYFRSTTEDENSVRDLAEKTNSGQKGVWVYEIGSSPLFIAITPGMTPGLPEEERETVTMLPRQPDEQPEEGLSTHGPPTTKMTEVAPEKKEESPEAETVSPGTTRPQYPSYPDQTGTSAPDSEPGQPRFTEPEPGQPRYTDPEPGQPRFTEPEPGQPRFTDPEPVQPRYTEPEPGQPRYTDPEPVQPRYTDSEPGQPRYTEPGQPRYTDSEPGQPRYTDSEPGQPRYTEPESGQPRFTEPEPGQPRYTEPEPVQPRYTEPEPGQPRYTEPEPGQPRFTEPEPVQPMHPYSRPHQPQIVVIDEEDENLNVNVFAYDLETCAHNRHKCSAFADCRDYSSGYCCHCRPGFYGNGKDCIAEGKPQRMNGKVKGRVFVGDSPVELGHNDLHSYVVANDGRAYVAISNVSDSLGPSLQPLSSLGGVIGWAFALQQPGYRNGFSIVGGQFSRRVEVLFQPGGERLSVLQDFLGVDERGHLLLSTELQGRLPPLPPGASVSIPPYREHYHHSPHLITSSSSRDYTVTLPDGSVLSRSFQWRQTVVFQGCQHATPPPATQQLTVDQIFVMFDKENHLIRYAMTNKIGSVHGDPPEQNPCFTGRHGCDINAMCRPGEGLQFTCECSNGFTGDGRYCHDIDECSQTPQICGSNAACTNEPGAFRCECSKGFVFARDGRTCIEENFPVDHCQRGSHDCDGPEKAFCSYTGGSEFVCSCLPGFVGDGRRCQDVDECQQDRCHREASCLNTQGSYTCQCKPGYHGDGFQCSPTTTEREQTECERQREKLLSSSSSSSSSLGFFSFFRPRPAPFIPQCDARGAFEASQCHAAIAQCWCVDAAGNEIPNTRSHRDSRAMCINQVVTPPPQVGPSPRPDLPPVAVGTQLLVAQSGRIEQIPLDGYDMKKEEAKPLLHVPDRVVIAVAFDCVEKTVYWSDITAPAISRASLKGGEITPIITSELQSPEGLAVDSASRLLFWTDSMRDTVEVSRLDGSHRRVLFDTGLVNPRPIATNPPYGRIFWADWNRDEPKIEAANMDGSDRETLLRNDLSLPNALTFDLHSQLLCWADAGTHKVECMDPHRRLRRSIVEGVQYPFSIVSYGKNLYYTDWRREAVVAVDRQAERETDEFLPQKRSRPYGVAMATTQCQPVFNYCSNNGGCSHLCLPRLGGFTCRCPDNDLTCVDGNL